MFEVTATARAALVLEVAIGGPLARPAVASVIAGATIGNQGRMNAAAADWEPSDADLTELLAC